MVITCINIKIIKKYKILLIFICCSAYFSCKKENVATVRPAARNQYSALGNSVPTGRVAGFLGHWDDVAKDCTLPGLNCECERTGVDGNYLISFNQIIDLNGTGVDFATFFSSPTGVALSQQLGLDAIDLANLQSGTYKVIRHESGSISGPMYYFFGPMPLSRLNAEYIIPVTVK